MEIGKPQSYHGILLNEEHFSEYFSNIWDSVTEHLDKETAEGIRDLVHQAYKEGYADA